MAPMTASLLPASFAICVDAMEASFVISVNAVERKPYTRLECPSVSTANKAHLGEGVAPVEG